VRPDDVCDRTAGFHDLPRERRRVKRTRHDDPRNVRFLRKNNTTRRRAVKMGSRQTRWYCSRSRAPIVVVVVAVGVNDLPVVGVWHM